MSDAEARDAYVAVEVPLPNGAIARGRPIPFDKARTLILLSEGWKAGQPDSETVFPLLDQFASVSGITQEYLLNLCPDMTLGELVDFVNRFFYSRRPAPTSAPAPQAGSPGSGAGA